MQNLQVLDFIWALMLFLTSHQFSRWHSSLCDSMCTWRCLCQNLPFLHITASMACLGGFPESWKGRETATLSLKGKTQQDSGTELPFVPLKIPSKVPAKAGYTSQTCPHTGTAVPGTFAPLTTINLFAKHQLPAPASPLVAASTSPPSSKAAPCHSSPLLTGASRTKSCPSKAYPAVHRPFSRSSGGTGGPWEAARLHVATAEVCEHILLAKNLRQRGGQQLGWESCCCLPSLHGRHKKKYCQAFHGVRAKHELPLQPRDSRACFSLCGGEFLLDCATGIRERAHGSNHGRVAKSHPNCWSQSCPAAAEREKGGKWARGGWTGGGGEGASKIGRLRAAPQMSENSLRRGYNSLFSRRHPQINKKE